jgi:hypothetical protein
MYSVTRQIFVTAKNFGIIVAEKKLNTFDFKHILCNIYSFEIIKQITMHTWAYIEHWAFVRDLRFPQECFWRFKFLGCKAVMFGSLFPTTLRSVWNHSPDNTTSRHRRLESLLNIVPKVPIPPAKHKTEFWFSLDYFNKDTCFICLMQCFITILEACIKQVIIIV